LWKDNNQPIEPLAKLSLRPSESLGVWGVSVSRLACEAVHAGPPVSIRKGFQSPVRNKTGRRASNSRSSSAWPRRVPNRQKNWCWRSQHQFRRAQRSQRRVL